MCAIVGVKPLSRAMRTFFVKQGLMIAVANSAFRFRERNFPREKWKRLSAYAARCHDARKGLERRREEYLMRRRPRAFLAV